MSSFVSGAAKSRSYFFACYGRHQKKNEPLGMNRSGSEGNLLCRLLQLVPVLVGLLDSRIWILVEKFLSSLTGVQVELAIDDSPGLGIDISFVAHRGADGTIATILWTIGLRALGESREMLCRNEFVPGALVLVRIFRSTFHRLLLVEIRNHIIALDGDAVLRFINIAGGLAGLRFSRIVSAILNVRARNEDLAADNRSDAQQHFWYDEFHLK